MRGGDHLPLSPPFPSLPAPQLEVSEPYEIPAEVVKSVADVLRGSDKVEVDAEGVKVRRKQVGSGLPAGQGVSLSRV